MREQDETYTEPTPELIIDRYYKALQAIRRFEGLKEAVDAQYPDYVIIRCEVTAGDIRALLKCLETQEKGSGK